MTLKDLTDKQYAFDRERYPSMPLHGLHRKVYRDKTANDLAKAIIACCELDGVMCSRTGSEGRYRPGSSVVDVIGRTRLMKGTWIPGHNVGQGDLQLVIKGKIYSVEIKIGKDRQSDVQKNFQAKLEKSGGVYVIVKTWEEFYNYYKKWIKQK